MTLSYSDTTNAFEITLSSEWQLSETAVGNVTLSDKKLLLAPENGLCRLTIKRTKNKGFSLKTNFVFQAGAVRLRQLLLFRHSRTIGNHALAAFMGVPKGAIEESLRSRVLC